MLFFRSEEAVLDWCTKRSVPVRPTVPLPQLWDLARVWYSSRFDPSASRPNALQIVEIFAGIGLVGDHWDPTATHSG